VTVPLLDAFVADPLPEPEVVQYANAAPPAPIAIAATAAPAMSFLLLKSFIP
jgi:hypothetical protein